jgi:phosphosulfolactate phosphohydrolase-like enzyme
MTKQEVLQKCTVAGNVIKLPTEQLDRKIYGEVKLALEKIGGKWKGGKVFGFEFEQNPTELLSQLADGEKVNLKKEFQFYPTHRRFC